MSEEDTEQGGAERERAREQAAARAQGILEALQSPAAGAAAEIVKALAEGGSLSSRRIKEVDDALLAALMDTRVKSGVRPPPKKKPGFLGRLLATPPPPKPPSLIEVRTAIRLFEEAFFKRTGTPGQPPRPTG